MKDKFPAFPALARNVVSLKTTPEHLLGLNTYCDMFCGIGGFHIAASSFGMRCVFASDIDEDARETYEHNFGIMPAGDISRIKEKDIPDHDLFCAGFPCQPFSIIGHRKGFSDMRGTLFFEIIRILAVKRPRAVILENVKQLTTIDKGRVIKRIVEELEALNYNVAWKVLNALDFGLPQKRERVIIAATLDSFTAFPWPTEKIPMKPLKSILEKKPRPKTFCQRPYSQKQTEKSQERISTKYLA